MSEKLVKESDFISFDGFVHLKTWHQMPDRYRHLEIDLGARPRIARGGGYSFSAASFGDGVLVQEMTQFNKFLEFDADLKTIKVQGGLKIGKLMEWAMAKRLYFPVLPGYPEITVGGCVAVDAHGKHPWQDGTFADWVLEITLYHPARGYLRLTRDHNGELFALTCGGFGLTGVIVDVTLQLTDLSSETFVITKYPVSSLGQAAEKLVSTAGDSDFIYSFHDGTRRGAKFGNGVVICGNWNPQKEFSKKKVYNQKVMTARSRAKLPMSIWTKLTAPLATRFFVLVSRIRSRSVMDVYKATFPFAFNTLYHRFFGRKGLAEVQLLVETAEAAEFIRRLEILVEELRPPLIMLSLKLFRGSQKSLSMSGSGLLIALNFYRDPHLDKFLAALDELALERRAQPNLSKDSRITSTVASRLLPNYENFKAQLRKFDSEALYQSELSNRIGL